MSHLSNHYSAQFSTQAKKSTYVSPPPPSQSVSDPYFILLEKLDFMVFAQSRFQEAYNVNASYFAAA